MQGDYFRYLAEVESASVKDKDSKEAHLGKTCEMVTKLTKLASKYLWSEYFRTDTGMIMNIIP